VGYSLSQVFRGGVSQAAQMSSKGLSAENCPIKTKFHNQILDMTKMMLTIIPAWVLSTRGRSGANSSKIDQLNREFERRQRSED
jgi:hypothetical protein